MASLTLKPSPFTFEKSSGKGLPTLARRSFRVDASGGKKIKTDKPYGMDLVPLAGSPRERVLTNLSDKYSANVDGYSPIYNQDEWTPSGDVYVGGTTGLAMLSVTLAGLLSGAALLVYNTTALPQ